LTERLVRNVVLHRRHHEFFIGANTKATSRADANWPNWYAEYIFHEQTGQSSFPIVALPQASRSKEIVQ
jgi:hypothetical protein